MVLGDGDRDWCRDGEPSIIVVILATTAVAIMATAAVAIMATTMATTIVTWFGYSTMATTIAATAAVAIMATTMATIVALRHGFFYSTSGKSQRSPLASSRLLPSEQSFPLPEEVALPPLPSPAEPALALLPLPSTLPL